MKVLWTRRARRDVEGIWDYIARDDPRAAQRGCTRLVDRAESICRDAERRSSSPRHRAQ